MNSIVVRETILSRKILSHTVGQLTLDATDRLWIMVHRGSSRVVVQNDMKGGELFLVGHETCTSLLSNLATPQINTKIGLLRPTLDYP